MKQRHGQVAHGFGLLFPHNLICLSCAHAPATPRLGRRFAGVIGRRIGAEFGVHSKLARERVHLSSERGVCCLGGNHRYLLTATTRDPGLDVCLGRLFLLPVLTHRVLVVSLPPLNHPARHRPPPLGCCELRGPLPTQPQHRPHLHTFSAGQRQVRAGDGFETVYYASVAKAVR